MAGAKKYDWVVYDVRKIKLPKKKKKRKLLKEDVYSIDRVPPYGLYEIKKKLIGGPIPKKLAGTWTSFEQAKIVLDSFEM